MMNFFFLCGKITARPAVNTISRTTLLFAFLMTMLLKTEPAAAQQTVTNSPPNADTSKNKNVVNTQFVKIKTGPTPRGTEGKQLLVKGIRISKRRILTFAVQTGLEDVIEMSKGNKLFLTLSNETTDTLTNKNDVRSKFERVSYGSLLRVDYELSVGDIINLTHSNIIAIKMQYNGGIFRFDLDEKQALKLKNVCLLIQ